MPQYRLWYGVQAIGFKPDGNVGAYTVAHGCQSAGSTTTFNLENIFEIGQQEIYEIVENNPDVDITIEKVIDGYPLIYHLATQGAGGDSLSARQNQKSIVAMSLFSDVLDSASGTPLMTVEMSGMYPSTLSYTLPVDGNCTESVTLVGSNQKWSNGGSTLYGDAFDGILFDNTDQPLALADSGGVQRRENVLFGTGASILPKEIPGIDSNGWNTQIAGVDAYKVHVQNITISTDLGRTELNELGRKNPYHRYVNFPVEVSTDIEIISTSGHFIDADEGQDNVTNQEIQIYLEEGLHLNMGTKNKLASVSTTGGDAGGDNSSITYSYRGFSLSVSHPQDPSA